MCIIETNEITSEVSEIFWNVYFWYERSQIELNMNVDKSLRVKYFYKAFDSGPCMFLIVAIFFFCQTILIVNALKWVMKHKFAHRFYIKQKKSSEHQKYIMNIYKGNNLFLSWNSHLSYKSNETTTKSNKNENKQMRNEGKISQCLP